ncbi:hypothetical protein B0J12DRAFT_705653 [Macrophomina phaseolina]|uniref:Uncharacterized protein n=1 Tax=Macrophomina phaseolina TaxID=35725 RepID=A0ABQ8FRH3_9PEZI|nr:hypothetical protein B0J12DRAFT_705653 [Macrophomina phaseolina]
MQDKNPMLEWHERQRITLPPISCLVAGVSSGDSQAEKEGGGAGWTVNQRKSRLLDHGPPIQSTSFGVSPSKLNLHGKHKTYLPTGEVEVDKAAFPLQSVERKLPLAIHLWLHENCPPAMNAIITDLTLNEQRTHNNSTLVHLAVKPGQGQDHPMFNEWLQQALRTAGSRFELSIMAQSWIAGALPPGHSVIFHLAPDGSVEWYFATGPDQLEEMRSSWLVPQKLAHHYTGLARPTRISYLPVKSFRRPAAHCSFSIQELTFYPSLAFNRTFLE